MRRKVFLAATLMTGLFVLLLFSSCAEEKKIDCEKICKKQRMCGWLESDDEIGKCKTNCEEGAGDFQESFIDTYNKCWDEACGDIEDCIGQSSDSCNYVDYMPMVNSLCNKALECDKIGERADCVTDFTERIEYLMQKEPINRCLSEKYYQRVSSCMDNIWCKDFDDDLRRCFDN